MKNKKSFQLIICLFAFMLNFSCSVKIQHKAKDSISVTNWNLQTFFDGNNDGIEYSDFRKSKEVWNEDFYEERLIKLCKIIEELDSDIFVMQELENEKIIYDISNRLSHNAWNKNKIYNYAVFGKENKNSIGCGVISKLPISDVKFHGMDVRTENDKMPQLRDVMEVCIELNENPISLYVNHWKSKSGGEEKSEKWRLWQENILAREMDFNKDKKTVFATGDFNKDINDFCRTDDNDLKFNFIDKEQNKELILYSPWDDEPTNTGTYFFRGKWEKIDHFFYTDKKNLKSFNVVQNQEIAKPDGTPKRYELYSHNGYSDHFPITSIVAIGNAEANP